MKESKDKLTHRFGGLFYGDRGLFLVLIDEEHDDYVSVPLSDVDEVRDWLRPPDE